MNNIREIIGLFIWFLITVFVMISSLSLGLGDYNNPGPGFFPFYSALLLGISSVLMMGNIFLHKGAVVIWGKADLWKDLNGGKIAVIIATLFAYCLVLSKLGYVLSTMAFMMVMFYLGKMKPWAVIAGSVLAVLLSYCIFLYGLKTPLPRGIFIF